MANYNKVVLVGNLTRDPELTFLPSQMAVAKFGMAINRTWKGTDGQKKEEVCFVDVQAFGKSAETINQYMTKGKQILIEGRLSSQSWQTQDGQKRQKLMVTAESFQFMGGDRGESKPKPENEKPVEPQQSNPEPEDDSIPF